METPALDKRSKKLALALFLVFQGLFGLTASGRVDRIADEFEVYLQAESLVDRGSLAIPQCPPQVYFGKVGKDGRQYAPYGPATAFLTLPHHLLGRGVAALVGVGRGTPAVWTPLVAAITSLATSTWAALAVAGLFVLALSVGATPRRALLQAALLGGATLLWTYATLFFSEPISAALLVWAAVFTVRRRPALACAAACLLFLTKTSSVIYVPVLASFGVAQAWGPKRDLSAAWRSVAPLIYAAFLAGLIHVDWNMRRYGELFEFGYSWEGVLRPGEAHRPFLASEVPGGVLGFLLSPGKSILLYAPPLLLTIPSLRPFFKKQPAAAALWVAAATLPLVFFGAWSYWEGGYCYGPRFLVTALPLLLLPLAAGPEPKRRWLVGCVVVGVAVQLLGVSVSYMEDQAAGGRDPGWTSPYYTFYTPASPEVPAGRPLNRYRISYVPFGRYTQLLARHLVSLSPGAGRTGLEFLPPNLLRVRARTGGAESPLPGWIPWLLVLPFPLLIVLGWRMGNKNVT